MSSQTFQKIGYTSVMFFLFGITSKIECKIWSTSLPDRKQVGGSRLAWYSAWTLSFRRLDFELIFTVELSKVVCAFRFQCLLSRATTFEPSWVLLSCAVRVTVGFLCVYFHFCIWYTVYRSSPWHPMVQQYFFHGSTFEPCAGATSCDCLGRLSHFSEVCFRMSYTSFSCEKEWQEFAE